MRNLSPKTFNALIILAAAIGIIPSQLTTAFADERMEIACEGPKTIVIPEIQLRLTEVNAKISGPVHVAAEIVIVRNHFFYDEYEWGMKRAEIPVRTVWNGNILTVPTQSISLSSRLFLRARRRCTDHFEMLKLILNGATKTSAKKRYDLEEREIYFTSSVRLSPNFFPIPTAPLKMDVTLKPMEVKLVKISKFIQFNKNITGGSCVATHLGVDQNGQMLYLQASNRFGVEADLTKAVIPMSKTEPGYYKLYGRSAEQMFNNGQDSCGTLGTHPLFYVETVVAAGLPRPAATTHR